MLDVDVGRWRRVGSWESVPSMKTMIGHTTSAPYEYERIVFFCVYICQGCTKSCLKNNLDIANHLSIFRTSSDLKKTFRLATKPCTFFTIIQFLAFVVIFLFLQEASSFVLMRAWKFCVMPPLLLWMGKFTVRNFHRGGHVDRHIHCARWHSLTCGGYPISNCTLHEMRAWLSTSKYCSKDVMCLQTQEVGLRAPGARNGYLVWRVLFPSSCHLDQTAQDLFVHIISVT